MSRQPMGVRRFVSAFSLKLLSFSSPHGSWSKSATLLDPNASCGLSRMASWKARRKQGRDGRSRSNLEIESRQMISLEAGPRSLRVSDCHTSCKCAHESKAQTSMLITCAQWPEPLRKFRSRKSEAASPIGAAPNASLRSLHLADLRRGLAIEPF
jgi:hypothetical protein